MPDAGGADPRIAYIVSHTHWDREWYLPFASFRTRLVEVVRGVLDALEAEDSSFEHFCLDGQAIVLEDLLAVAPEEEARIRRLAHAGKLSLGPWYILPDEFLISSEATVRNLQLGHRVAGQFGNVQKVGYMPDSFGHVAQVPQILRQAGIDSFIYTRGNGDEIETVGGEYEWVAPDGSAVFAVNQCRGYCNAGGLGFDEIWHAHTNRAVSLDRAEEQVRDLFRAMGEHGSGDVALLNNGCDHFPVQQDFDRIMARLREAFPDTEFRHGSFASFIDEARAANPNPKRFEGELVSGRLHHILSGVWSARMPLKQQNDRCQTLLASCWEPLEAYAHFMLGRRYAAGLQEWAWKRLLENHPHDSICGCSIDEVHRDMGPRFGDVLRTAESAMQEHLRALVPTFAREAADDATTVIGVFNPLPERQHRVIERLIVLQPGPPERIEALVLLDDAGDPVPLEIVQVDHVERFWGVDVRQELWSEVQREHFDASARRQGTDRFLFVRFHADLPALGHATFRLVEDAARVTPPTAETGVWGTDETLENALVALTLHPDGRFDLRDKRTGRCFDGLGVLEDAGDVGDEYDFSPAPRASTLTSRGADGVVSCVEEGTLRRVLEARFDLVLPAGLTPDRQGRRDEVVPCPVRVRVALDAGSPIVDVCVYFENRVPDHRLRILFPTDVQADALCSDGHFHENIRSLDLPDDAVWVQPHPGTFPQQDFSLVEDARGGLAVLNRGLPEIAATRTDEGVEIALTLLRCVGWLSRDDFASRRHSNAGPTVPTPDAQCLGPHEFRFALVPFAGDRASAGIRRLSNAWRAPLPAVQGVEDLLVPGGASLLRLEAPLAALTAVTRQAERGTLILRLFNPGGEGTAARLHFGFAPRAAWRVNLLEERQEALGGVTQRTLDLEFGPHEILTIEVEP